MAKKKAKTPAVAKPVDDEIAEEKNAGVMNWRGWTVRAVLLTVLVFAFVLWRLYPIRGNAAFLWAFGLAGLIMGWYVISYYILNR